MSDMQREHDRENDKNAERISGLENSLEEVIRELQVLQDAKLSLELEISCYRKLLETEENRYSATWRLPRGSEGRVE